MDAPPEAQHVLSLCRGQDDDNNNNNIIVNLVKQKERHIPLYSISHNSEMSKMDLRRIKCDAVSTEHRPVGAVKFRTIPPRIDVTVRGVSFKMTRRHPLSDIHSFRFLGAGEMRWQAHSKRGQGLTLVDFNGKTLANFRPRMRVTGEGRTEEKAGTSGQKSGWAPGFELYADKLADLDLDLIVTTGLAAAEYRRQLDHDWDGVAEGDGL